MFGSPSALRRPFAWSLLLAVLANAPAQTFDLLVRSEGTTGRIDLDAGTYRPAPDDTPRHLRIESFEDQGLSCRVADWPALASPDGRTLAFLVHTGKRPSRRRLAVLGADGSPQLVPFAGECHTPVWLPDGRTLWFVQEEPTEASPRLARFELGTRTTEVVASADVRLQPTPTLLADGQWCLLRRNAPEGEASRFELVVQDRLTPSSVRQVVHPDATFVRRLASTANGLVVWFTFDQELLRYDRVQRRITHRWPRTELLPGDGLCYGDLLVRPDTDAAVLTLWHDHPGVDLVAPVLVHLEVPTEGPPRLRRIELEHGVMLHGFVPRKVALPPTPSAASDQR